MTIKYIGDGTAYFPGVPMRDLEQDEWDALSDNIKTALVAAKLFDAKAPKVQATPTASNKGGGG